MKKENMIFRLKMEIASLVNEMISKLPDTLFLSDSTTFLDPSMASGQYVAAIEQRLRKHGHSDENIKSRVFGVEKNMLRINYAIKKNKLVGTYSVDKNDIPSILIGNMKFDAIVGNPPYQKKVGERKTEPLWHIFVENSIKSLKDGGYLCYVHPPGWRNVDGIFADIGEKIKSKDVQYLETHSVKDGLKTFSATTPYDWYVLKNTASEGNTVVRFQDGTEAVLDLNKIPFIPNGGIKNIISLIAKEDEEKCEVLYDRTEYGTDKKNMSVAKAGEFKYPCVRYVYQDGEIDFLYSNKKGKHFGISKIIFGIGADTGEFLIDGEGKYGMTNWCYAIVDEPKNLPKIKKALSSIEFKTVMENAQFNRQMFNRKVLALFRKDFYKDFI
jgi:Eco57I restriction-modification methylase